MYSKACLSRATQVDAVEAERFTDLLYEVGHDLLERKHYEDAAKWLERASDILTDQNVEKLSSDAQELKLSVTSCLVKALLGLQEENARAKASDLIDFLQTEVGDKLVVLLLRLELLSVNHDFDPTDYHDYLRRVISTVHLTDSNTKMILHHVYKLKSRNSALACTTLDQLYVRLLDTDKENWVEKVFIARIWTSTAFTNSADAVYSLREFLEMVTANRAKTLTLTASATHAAHILLWKQVEVMFSQQQYDVARSWCQIALHAIFESSGWLNIAKIERKLLLCALQSLDVSSAREIYSQMSAASKEAPMTKYLVYKLALRSEDEDLGKRLENTKRGHTGLLTDQLPTVLTRSAMNHREMQPSCTPACWRHSKPAINGKPRLPCSVCPRNMTMGLHEGYIYPRYYGKSSDSLWDFVITDTISCTARLLISEVEDGTCDPDAICNLFEGGEISASHSEFYDSPF